MAEKGKSGACDWCCLGGPLNIGPGKFRDFDSDFAYGIPICGGCGGLGRQYASDDFKARAKRIMELRFKYCPGPEEESWPSEDLREKYRAELEKEVIELWTLFGEGQECFARDIASAQESKYQLRVSQKLIELFQFKEGSIELPGLNPELLANLNDLVRKFGIDDPMGVRRISSKFPSDIGVTVSSEENIASTLVFGEGGQMTEGCFSLKLQDGFVLWDKLVSSNDIKELIRVWDGAMKARGGIDSDTGERLRRPYRKGPPEKRSVEQTFSKPGAVMMVTLPYPNAEALISEFDHPEELVTISSPLGGMNICRKSDLPILQRRREVVIEILAIEGISESDIAKLSLDEVLALRKKIDEAMAQRKRGP